MAEALFTRIKNGINPEHEAIYTRAKDSKNKADRAMARWQVDPNHETFQAFSSAYDESNKNARAADSLDYLGFNSEDPYDFPMTGLKAYLDSMSRKR